ncbi:hypothetical protein DL769_008449 [Monosporascus sp. CRB-8-3]|nr:hypothetical protein DL769_008449 [Monosporascus sp. CRB-8-3]
MSDSSTGNYRRSSKTTTPPRRPRLYPDGPQQKSGGGGDEGDDDDGKEGGISPQAPLGAVRDCLCDVWVWRYYASVLNATASAIAT